MSNSRPRVFLAAPGYGHQTAAAGRGIWRACSDMSNVTVPHLSSSLLAANFNGLWCAALNEEYSGDGVDYFAMLHSDIGPEDFWLDSLIAELEEKDLDVLGVVAPIKDNRGLTSCAVDGDSTWRPRCRITMKELARLPSTFTSDHVGGNLLINTGCWVCKFDLEWATKVKFTINDRIVFNQTTNKYMAECEPEDWYFSRLCHELGLRIGCTRKVKLHHRGEIDYSNQNSWGNDFDAEYGNTESMLVNPFPNDIPGWLHPDEGFKLAELSEGKDVLEVGSYCGCSTVCIARTAKSVACVDYWDGRGTAVPMDTYPEFCASLEKYGVSNKVSEYTPDEPLPESSFDVAFIDGAHDEESVTKDIEKALGSLRPGGVLVFHDYRSDKDPGVTEAVDKFIDAGATLIETVETLAIVRPPVQVPS